jgi:FkbH-like protein
MTLGQALAALNLSRQDASPSPLYLACGFQPLHLVTFLKAYFATRFHPRGLDVQTGLYGDLEGTLSAAAASSAQAAAVVVEWADLDPRLGLRSSGGWGPSIQSDILSTSRDRLARILAQVRAVAVRMPVALARPSLASPLFGQTAGWQFSAAEAELEQLAATFIADASRLPNVSVIHPGYLARTSPEPNRLDPKMELGAGFPYSLAHVSALADQLVKVLYPPPPMRGLITDLDDTLWSGIVGEIGASAVSWGLAEHAQIHGLYQQQLRQLSELGVLLAIASKNEPATVDQALGRADLHISAEAFFPVCANWNAKSKSVAEILRVWNIGADQVVFVDDSAMELDEVHTAFPAMTCLPFPKSDPAKALELMRQLRDLFGKPAVQREDALRLSGIRASATIMESGGAAASSQFLRQLEGRVVFDNQKDPANKRVRELINKTNQFNLNGARIAEGEWMRFLEDECSFVLSISYEDKFGPLGIISAVAGKQHGHRLDISAWVLSCRAFSRKIEFHTLDYLFRVSGVDSVALAFAPTDKNAPLQAFFRDLSLPTGSAGDIVVSREMLALDGELPHRTIPDQVPAQRFAMEGAVDQSA